MQRQLTFRQESEEEEIKRTGLSLDFDEIARKGSMSREETAVAKWYGIYSSRQPGHHMARVVIPGGQITTAQARVLAACADRYAQGKLAVTTRQSLQFHALKVTELAGLLRDLAAGGLTTFHGCGDVTRNVAACPLADTCRYRRLNVRPAAREIAAHLSACRDLDNLPRKFKITLSGCGAGCGQPVINCVGIVAVRRRTPTGQQDGYRVLIGGGMGWKAFPAVEVFSFVPPEKIVAVTRAVGLLFRDHGDRFNRAKSRLKFVIQRLGIAACREIVVQFLKDEGVDTANLDTAAFEEIGPEYPERPLAEDNPVGTDGGVTVRAFIPKGELESGTLRRLAELAEQYGDKRLYTTNRQNFELHGVAPERAAAAAEQIQSLGFVTDGSFGLRDIVTCVGTTYCPLAVSQTRAMYDRLLELVRRPAYAAIADRAIINITGCPNSCSPFRIADIGLRGMRLRAEAGSVEGYEMRLGGTHDQFGRVLGNFTSDDCSAVVERLLDTFIKVRRDGETLAACARRLDGPKDPFLAAIAPFARPRPAAPPLAEFSTACGSGEAAGDFQTVAKDIPCQEACPAKTNVPAYIEAIAQGDPEASYRINQEDNVFPGVLGRICTRPCETRCRHQWTNTLGPVHICHLKRSAADGSKKPTPLPRWFKPTGRRVAVIGGGPAGLTAARELSRYGHAVTVFEKSAELGGMMAYGIPKFRLPREVIRAEIDAILDGGVEARCNEPIDSARIASLAKEHDAVLIAAGATRPTPLNLPGLPEGTGVNGLAFMRQYNAGEVGDLRGKRVLVIGGGFTAVDCARGCARAAARLVGADGSVAIMYRRTEAQMSATQDELDAMHEEQIEVETLVSPVEAIVAGGTLQGVIFQRNRLGPGSSGGKPEFLPIPDSRFERPCDLLIIAIGQSPAPDLLPEGVRATEDHRTTDPRVFLSGDFRVGSQDVIHAVADGKAAAAVIDATLMGRVRRKPSVAVEPLDNDGKTGRVRDHDLQTPLHGACLPIIQRDATAEVERGFDAAQTQLHATRCYLCHYKYEIDQDLCIHCDWCIKVSPRNCIRRLARLVLAPDGKVLEAVDAPTAEEGTYIWIDSDQCIRCGKCLRVCPVEAISMSRMRRECNPAQ